jgi:type I restriction enzyme S subunit
VDVVNNRVDRAQLLYLDAETHLKISRYIVNSDDVCLAIVGTIGMVFYIDPEWDQSNLTENAARITDFDHSRILPKFIFYYLVSSLGQYEIMSRIVGSVQGKLPLQNIKSLPIPLPPLHEQRAIAAILGALDDKIDLNRRQNATLEATARALFQSWFVDFDPVHAKSRGELPAGMDAETAALFPDSFEDSALGLIPRGWRVATVQQLGAIVTGKTPPTRDSTLYGGNLPFIKIPDMHKQTFITQTEVTLSAKGSAFQQNKLLPPYSICVSCIATPGIVSITSVPSHTNQQINSIIPLGSPYFVYFTLLGLSKEIILRGSGGSATLNLNKGEFGKLVILMPSSDLVARFHELVTATFSQILNNEHNSSTLQETRDALLPKLISGEVRVGEVTSDNALDLS